MNRQGKGPAVTDQTGSGDGGRVMRGVRDAMTGSKKRNRNSIGRHSRWRGCHSIQCGQAVAAQQAKAHRHPFAGAGGWHRMRIVMAIGHNGMAHAICLPGNSSPVVTGHRHAVRGGRLCGHIHSHSARLSGEEKHRRHQKSHYTLPQTVAHHSLKLGRARTYFNHAEVFCYFGTFGQTVYGVLHLKIVI